MAKQIPEIDETTERLETIEQAERERRDAWLKMERARLVHKDAKETYALAEKNLQIACGARLEPMPLFDQDEKEDTE